MYAYTEKHLFLNWRFTVTLPLCSFKNGGKYLTCAHLFSQRTFKCHVMHWKKYRLKSTLVSQEVNNILTVPWLVHKTCVNAYELAKVENEE